MGYQNKWQFRLDVQVRGNVLTKVLVTLISPPDIPSHILIRHFMDTYWVYEGLRCFGIMVRITPILLPVEMYDGQERARFGVIQSFGMTTISGASKKNSTETLCRLLV